MRKNRMSKRDRDDFTAYVRHCTNAQVQGVYDKEHAAGRVQYARLAIEEATRRDMFLDSPRAGCRVASASHEGRAHL